MLNLIESYERPSSFSRVSGIPDNWNRSPYNSPKTVRGDLFSVIERVPARYVLISYNSEGFIQYEEFMDELSKYREVTIVDAQYNTYKASRNLSNRDTYVTEYLFVVKK
jgi:adenine-specific DNA-methyltransferase